MKKLSFEKLTALAENIASNELLEQITGGTENDCHDDADTSSGSSTPVLHLEAKILGGA